MSGESNANKEFEEQLRMQKLYDKRNEDGSDPFTYTDPEDGTVYDWDQEKKAWFPKVWTSCLPQVLVSKLQDLLPTSSIKIYIKIVSVFVIASQ